MTYLNSFRYLMEIRDYHSGEEQQLWQLFYQTVHNVNTQHYSAKQINAWAPDEKEFDLPLWIQKTKQRAPFVCLIEQQIVGYSDLQPSGYIDHFFCHYQHQKLGVGSALMSHIHKLAKQQRITELTADVSITARPFFEHKGFEVLKEQQVPIRGQILTNYKMRKRLES